MQDENNNMELQEPEEKEMNFFELFGKLWQNKRTLIWAGVVGMVIGLIVAFSIPKEYTASIQLAPEISNNTRLGGVGLNALASMAGINFNNSAGTDAVNPMLYPDIVESIPFVTDLFNVPVVTEHDENMTFRDFISHKTTSPWWNYVKKFPTKVTRAVESMFIESENKKKQSTVDPYRLSLDQTKLVASIRNCITLDVDPKTSIISVIVSLQDPLVSALIADTVVSRLQEYVTNYRTEKARMDLEYAKRINEEAKVDYHKAQQRYAAYVDRNHGISSRSGQTEEERLQNDVNLTFSLYNTTSQQYQMARAKVQEITPVFTVLKPATVPIEPTKPKKLIILIAWIFMAVAIVSAWVLFGKDMMANLKKATSSAETSN